MVYFSWNGDIAKRMSIKAGLSGRFTNHSGRKTATTTLVNENIPVNEIMQLTGHKSVKSINDYSTASIRKQQEMSTALFSANKPKAGSDTTSIDSTLRAIENFENSVPAPSVPLEENFANAEFEPVPNEYQESVDNCTTAVVESNRNNNVSLPLTSSPGGSLSVQFAQNKFHPQSMFQGCTFHAPISITINSK